VGVGAGVDAGVTGTTRGVANGGLGWADFGIVCSGCPIDGPVLPGWTILFCRIVCVCIVGCKVNRTF
jgi:hypothetical protein